MQIVSSCLIILASLLARNIFLGAPYSYELNGGAYSGHDDTQPRLTDEWTSPSYNQWDYVKLSGADRFGIIFDIGESPHELSLIEIDAINTPMWGICLPSSVVVETSHDGKSFYKVCEVKTPDLDGKDTKYLYSIPFDKALKERFVKVILNRTGKGVVCLDEIRGFEFCANGPIDFGAGKKTDETSDYYATPSAVHFLPMKAGVAARNTPAPDLFKKLSDGILAASPEKDDPAWVKFIGGGGRHLIFDLGACRKIRALEGQFLNAAEDSVSVPPILVASASNDGKNWTVIYGKTTGMYPGRGKSLWKWKAGFRKACAARYVRVSFETERVYSDSKAVYLSELSVIADKGETAPAELPADRTTVFGCRPSERQCPRNAVFFASIKCGDSAKWLTPELAGELLNYYPAPSSGPEVLFDGIVITDLHGSADASLLREAAFASGYNLDACSGAIEEYNRIKNCHRDLGVWFTLTAPSASVNPDRYYRYFRDQVDKIFEMWNLAGFKNLKLEGFYYIDEGEGIHTAKAIKALSAYLARKKSGIFWCPYYGQTMTWEWADRGYTWACYQPNTMFHGHCHDNLPMAAESSWIQGMAMEIEIDHPQSDVVRDMYHEYLKTARDYGADKGVKLFYIGGTPSALNVAARSHDPGMRKIYDETYKFIKGR